jgi:hypothetical protein
VRCAFADSIPLHWSILPVMLSKIFANTELDTFAKSLAQALVQRYPVELHRAQPSQL